MAHIIIQENDKKEESDANAVLKKKDDSDSEEEEQDNQQKEKGISNKKKKVRFVISIQFSILAVIITSTLWIMTEVMFMVFQLHRRMKIAELKQISTRPDVVEVKMVDNI